jgi:hypothetical protein
MILEDMPYAIRCKKSRKIFYRNIYSNFRSTKLSYLDDSGNEEYPLTFIGKGFPSILLSEMIVDMRADKTVLYDEKFNLWGE